MPTDTTERGLEQRVCALLTHRADAPDAADVRERPATYEPGWLNGHSADYDREHCIDLAQLTAFLKTTQPHLADALSLDADSPTRRKFLARLKNEVGKRGIVEVLRNGVKHGPHAIALLYATPSPGNPQAAALYEQNRFSVTRQLSYSNANKRLTLDLALFINGLPVATFELKNSLTKQTAADAVEQYKRDRDPKEELFRLGRCMVHFAVDDLEVLFCTHLNGKASWFLPFNKGWNDGTGNPPNPNGIKTDYLWRDVLTRRSLTDIVENYALLIESTAPETGRKTKTQIWPRYHQLDVVRKLLASVAEHGVGQRYLIQHSAGSGKSNSIAWLAHRLIGLEKGGRPVFDSIIVVTDRIILDRQINDTIRQFAQVGATVGHAENAGDLRRFIGAGKKVIISTVQKFPFILDVLGHYTPVTSYYRLAKTTADDPEFDANKAHKKLIRYVETHSRAIRPKAEIIVDHFHEQVLAPRKIGGQARAMVVTGGIEVAIAYYRAICDYLAEAVERIAATLGDGPHRDFNLFVDAVRRGIKLTARRKKLLQTALAFRDEATEPVVKKTHRPGKTEPDPLRGLVQTTVNERPCVVEYEPDSELRDAEQVPLLAEGGVEGYLRREVLPYAPDAWYDPASVKVGYEISFTRHFYKPQPLRSRSEIRADILTLERENEAVLAAIIGADGRGIINIERET